jgi:hypothetical protein
MIDISFFDAGCAKWLQVSLKHNINIFCHTNGKIRVVFSEAFRVILSSELFNESARRKIRSRPVSPAMRVFVLRHGGLRRVAV